MTREILLCTLYCSQMTRIKCWLCTREQNKWVKTESMLAINLYACWNCNQHSENYSNWCVDFRVYLQCNFMPKLFMCLRNYLIIIIRNNHSFIIFEFDGKRLYSLCKNFSNSSLTTDETILETGNFSSFCSFADTSNQILFHMKWRASHFDWLCCSI